MTDKKLYAVLAAIVAVVAIVDVAYFSMVDVVEAAPTEALAAVPDATTPAAMPDATTPDEAAPDGTTPDDTPDNAPDNTASPTAALDAETIVAPSASSISECSFDPDIPAFPGYASLVTFADPFEGNPNSPVKVFEFFDPNCPHCRSMHPVMKRVMDMHADDAQFFVMPFIVFQQSLNQIEALYVAAQEGKYMEMVEAQFARQTPQGLSVEELGVIATELGLDADVFMRRVERGLNRQLIGQRRQQISGLGIRGVPSVMINGRVVALESKTVDCLSEMILSAGS